jgi:diazepam-binding inhibitor (GABA receptor modulating acyl-CoA-binding protein)
MSELQAQFEQAAQDAQNLSSRPSNDVMLQLYSLYKQATEGDVQGKRPGFTNMVGRAKYDAWAKLRGKSNDTAMQEYVALVKKLQGA